MHTPTSLAFGKTRFLISSAFILAVAGCGGGGSDSSSDSLAGSMSVSCNYPDLISASEHTQANACGIQVSANYAQADSGLQEVIAACKQGQKTTADNYYKTTYQQMVDYARSVSKQLSCGAGGVSLPQSTVTHYNFCTKSYTNANSQLAYRGVCHGPANVGDGSCGSGSDGNGGDYSAYSLVAEYASSSACSTAGQNWVNTH